MTMEWILQIMTSCLTAPCALMVKLQIQYNLRLAPVVLPGDFCHHRLIQSIIDHVFYALLVNFNLHLGQLVVSVARLEGIWRSQHLVLRGVTPRAIVKYAMRVNILLSDRQNVPYALWVRTIVA